MQNFIIHDEWKIIEDSFHAENNLISESLFSIGNGNFGQRGMFEEKYSGPSLQGSYIAGVYYPDKTIVGWWKNGYPEYFAKVLNAPDWKSVHITVNDEELDLAKCIITGFRRELDMRTGILTRHMNVTTSGGISLRLHSLRFCSLASDDTALVQYSITPLNANLRIQLSLFIDGTVTNSDSNYGEVFWNEVKQKAEGSQLLVISETRKTKFLVATGCEWTVDVDEHEVPCQVQHSCRTKYAGAQIETTVLKEQTITATKYVGIVTSQNFDEHLLEDQCINTFLWARNKGAKTLIADQVEAWADKWKHSDIVIEGDVAAQQGIRFNIFHLNQTYTGKDSRLNIGPKGFTGEKYGGSTYWDTEAYCIPFYLSTADEGVARNLLTYRYKHLPRAIENAAKLGFKNGAALFPMVTMNGEECHNEWEITFEEIHRNGAIAYAIYNYSKYTDDKIYLYNYGVELLIAVARFWSQRVNWSTARSKFVILGVTGPNEYENNVNNNWYTNYIAQWCLRYTIESIIGLKKYDIVFYNALAEKISFNEAEETHYWQHIIDNLHLPGDTTSGIFLQQDGYLDKEQTLVNTLASTDRPLHQNWSWDRILRSCFIKQADVLQGLYFFEDDFSTEQITANFNFYEPRTVHESSLSPCVHSIIASHIGNKDKAYEMYLRTARLDLDNYNNDTSDGCHITSMAGTWMSIVMGFGGMRVKNNMLCFSPSRPDSWTSFSFTIKFRKHLITIVVYETQIIFHNINATNLNVMVYNKVVTIKTGEPTIFKYAKTTAS